MKRFLILIIAVLLGVAIFKMAIFDNVDFLFILAGGSNQPSSLFNFAIERIYKLSEKKDIGKKLIKELKEHGDFFSLQDLYVRTLGVIGEEDAFPCLMEIYIRNQDKKVAVLDTVILSLGLLGKEDAVPILERILNREDGWFALLNFPIAQSLYLLTGKKYTFINSRGESQELFVTPELLQAREVIVATKGKKRKYKDMLILDKLFRPPKRR